MPLRTLESQNIEFKSNWQDERKSIIVENDNCQIKE